MDLPNFFTSLSSHWEQLQRHYFTDDLGLAERLVERSEECAEVLRSIHGRVHERVSSPPMPGILVSVLDDLCTVLTALSEFMGHYEDIVERELSCIPSITGSCPVQQSGSVGRPRYVVDEQQIEAMIELGCNYERMAAILGISSRTLRRRRSEYGFCMGRNYTDISDGELDHLISSILRVS